MASLESLSYMIKQLRLPSILRVWQEEANKAAEQGLSHAAYLARLMDIELTSRLQSRLARAYQEAKLPSGKTLATFSFASVDVNRLQIISLAEDPTWVKNAHNLLLFGSSGVGKTHLAASIGYALIQQGVKVLFTSTSKLVQSLQQAKATLQLNQALERLSRFELLILDDFGYVKKTEQESSVLFELIAHRYESGSLLITANQSFTDWENIFPDAITTVAAIDRLVHHATIIPIKGQSYRMQVAQHQNSLSGEMVKS